MGSRIVVVYHWHVSNVRRNLSDCCKARMEVLCVVIVLYEGWVWSGDCVMICRRLLVEAEVSLLLLMGGAIGVSKPVDCHGDYFSL